MRRSMLHMAFAAGLSLSAGEALAQAAVPTVEQTCQPTARRLCGASAPDLERVQACVTRYPKRFAPFCRTAIDNQRANDAARRRLVDQPPQPGARPCENDVGIVCGTMPPDSPRAFACLRSQRAALSAQCRTWVDGQP